MVRGGASLEQPIYAGDVVEAILRALVTPGLGGTRLDLAGPETLPGRELAQRAASVLGGTPRVIPIPLLAARLVAGLAERVFIHPPLTRAMLGVLEHDDDIDPTPACRRLSVELTPLDVTLKRCLAETPG
jgi:NADH dehydrogenase